MLRPRAALPFLAEVKAKSGAVALFWSRVRRGAEDECWPWLRANGEPALDYGRFHVDGMIVNSNRVAWALANDTDPVGRVVRHTCDNPPCCNPKHLIDGTHADNARDKVERRRWRGGDQAGASNPRACLKPSDIPEIVAAFRRGETNKRIAERYPVGHSLISRICTGRAWVAEAAAAGWEPAVANHTAFTPQPEGENQC